MVKTVEQFNRQAVRDSVLKQKKFIKRRTDENKKIDKALTQQRHALQKQHRADLENLRTDNRIKEEAEIARHQETLANANRKFSKNMKNLDNQRLKIQDSHQNRIKNLQAKQSNQLNKQIETNSLQQKELSDANEEYLFKLKQDLEHAKTVNQMRAGHELNQNAYAFEQKVEKQNDDHALKYKINNDRLSRDIAAQEVEHLKETESLKRFHEGELAKNKEAHVDKLAKQEKFYKQLIKQRRENFESQYRRLLKAQEDSVQMLKLQVKNSLDSIRKSNADKKSNYTDRMGDPFYNSTILQPKLEDKIGEYIIKLEIPDYERDSVILHGDNRQIRLTFSRRMTDNLKNPDGSVNKTSRSEVYTKVLQVPEIIDPSTITQNYTDGTLQFKIKKA